jgi:tRNA threonylcarbamoyladenosine biosynthesis protein TsaE
MEFITKSDQETKNLALNLTKNLKGGEMLALYGELGSGKTTFVQGLAKGLGIKRRVISPTFLIVRTYSIEHKEAKFFFHIDLYRIEKGEDIKSLGILELLNNPENIVAIEWADRMDNLLPKRRIDIYFEVGDNNKRQIKVLDHG